MATRYFRDVIPEGSSRVYSTALVDASAAAIDPAAVTAMTVTLRDVDTGEIVNSRDAQPCLDANGGALGADGVFTFAITPEDTVTIGDQRFQERRLTFHVVYNGGVENREVRFWIENLADIS